MIPDEKRGTRSRRLLLVTLAILSWGCVGVGVFAWMSGPKLLAAETVPQREHWDAIQSTAVVVDVLLGVVGLALSRGVRWRWKLALASGAIAGVLLQVIDVVTFMLALSAMHIT